MNWRSADIVWNGDTYPGIQENQLEGVLQGVMATVEGAWLHIFHEGSVRSYPSHVVLRVNWHATGISDC